jgi:protein ImuB
MQFDTRSLWIYIHFPKLQLDLIEASEVMPEDDKKAHTTLPRAVVNVNTNALCQLNKQAIAQGLRLNMGLASASLNCSELQLHEYNEELESKQIVNLADHLYLVTSDIVLAPPSALILRVQNMLNLHGGLKPYWLTIKQVLQRQSVHFIEA